VDRRDDFDVFEKFSLKPVTGMIIIDRVSKTFDGGRSFAVADLSLEIRQGETLVLLGSSGCGKTTTLKMINGLVEPTRGGIQVNGCRVEKRSLLSVRRSIGYVFQGIGLFPHLTVRQNVEMVPRLLGWAKERRAARARTVLELVGLEPRKFADRFPRQLSGGQQQRVGIARALAADPQYMLMDEPFGALDPLSRETLQQEVLRLKQSLRKTIVFVTHDIFEALTLADRIAVMHGGHLEQVGTAEELLTKPATAFVADLFHRAGQQCKLLRRLAS